MMINLFESTEFDCPINFDEQDQPCSFDTPDGAKSGWLTAKAGKVGVYTRTYNGDSHWGILPPSECGPLYFSSPISDGARKTLAKAVAAGYQLCPNSWYK